MNIYIYMDTGSNSTTRLKMENSRLVLGKQESDQQVKSQRECVYVYTYIYIHIYIYIHAYIYIYIYIYITKELARACARGWVHRRDSTSREPSRAGARGGVYLGLYTILPLPILYGVWYTQGGGSGGASYIAQ